MRELTQQYEAVCRDRDSTSADLQAEVQKLREAEEAARTGRAELEHLTKKQKKEIAALKQAEKK